MNVANIERCAFCLAQYLIGQEWVKYRFLASEKISKEKKQTCLYKPTIVGEELGMLTDSWDNSGWKKAWEVNVGQASLF